MDEIKEEKEAFTTDRGRCPATRALLFMDEGLSVPLAAKSTGIDVPPLENRLREKDHVLKRH